MNIYPNPAHDQVSISFEGATSNDVTIRLMDASGREMIRRNENINGHFDGKLDVRKLSKGIYLIEVKSGSMTAKRRLSID